MHCVDLAFITLLTIPIKLSAYFGLVQQVYNAGGRKFLFVLVPPVNRSPLVSWYTAYASEGSLLNHLFIYYQMLAQSTSSQTLEGSVIATFNQKLVAAASSFASKNSGATTYTYDANAKVTQVLNSPTSYGFVDATSYGDVVHDCWCKCCWSPGC